MSEIILYATKPDANMICQWINAERDVAWIIKVAERDGEYHWKAVDTINALEEQIYALWHIKSGPLNIPSGKLNIRDQIISDPFAGWRERMTSLSGASSPWFGGNLPGPYSFSFAESGQEAPGSLARSGFHWLEDRYKAIGKAAHPEAKLWWQKLKRFVKKSSTAIPLMPADRRSPTAYAFPDAKGQIEAGRHRDVNPPVRKLRKDTGT